MTCQVGSYILGHWRGKKSRGCKFVSCQWIANYLSSKIDWKPEREWEQKREVQWLSTEHTSSWSLVSKGETSKRNWEGISTGKALS